MHCPGDYRGVGPAHPLHRRGQKQRERREDQDRLDSEAATPRQDPAFVASLHPRLPLRCGLCVVDVLLLSARPSDGIEDEEHVALSLDPAERREVIEYFQVLAGHFVLLEEAGIVQAVPPYVTRLLTLRGF